MLNGRAKSPKANKDERGGEIPIRLPLEGDLKGERRDDDYQVEHVQRRPEKVEPEDDQEPQELDREHGQNGRREPEEHLVKHVDGLVRMRIARDR